MKELKISSNIQYLMMINNQLNKLIDECKNRINLFINEENINKLNMLIDSSNQEIIKNKKKLERLRKVKNIEIEYNITDFNNFYSLINKVNTNNNYYMKEMRQNDKRYF